MRTLIIVTLGVITATLGVSGAPGALGALGAAGAAGAPGASGAPGAAGAQAEYIYAIQGARVVPVSGPVVENGTVVFRDGVITAVGANATVPPGAMVVAGKGLTHRHGEHRRPGAAGGTTRGGS
jgi:pilus assembly protein FimV